MLGDNPYLKIISGIGFPGSAYPPMYSAKTLFVTSVFVMAVMIPIGICMTRHIATEKNMAQIGVLVS